MVTLAVVCCGLLSALPAGADASAPDPAAYEAAYKEARSRAGRDPDAHVRLALWCEARGLTSERLRHLAIATMIDPKHAAARGLMGLVSHAGRWSRPEAVAELARADAARLATLETYRARRDRTPETPDDQWKLALWCEQNGLAEEAKAHLTRVTRLDPDHAAARKRLGYKKQAARWVTDAQLAAEKASAELQKKADRAWKPRLERYRAMLAGKDPSKRDEAERALREVTDPRAVPSILSVFAGSAARQAIAVQLLGQIDGPSASQALATLAVFSESAEVRRSAIQTLARRDLRDFAGMLVQGLRDPIQYEVKPVGGPGSPGMLFVEGKEYDVRRSYGSPAVHPFASLPRFFSPDTPFEPFSPQNLGMGLPHLRRFDGFSISWLAQNPLAIRSQLDSDFGPPTRAAIGAIAANPGDARAILSQPGSFEGRRSELNDFSRNALGVAAARDIQLGHIAVDIQRANLAAQQNLDTDVRAIEQTNTEIRQMNARLLPVLEGVSGQALGEDREAWQDWWVDQMGFWRRPYEPGPKPTIEEFIVSPFPKGDVTLMSCFGAGTMVKTRDGSSPIESVKVGDQVLAQDVQTGTLGYQPVVAVFHNPPTAPLKVTIGGEAIVATKVHRFWKAGHGWVMARDLEVGDTLRTLGGVAKVEAIGEEPEQPVFNLEVAGHNTFFVGDLGALVHDNNVVMSTPEPFDAAPALTAAASAGSGSPR